MANEQLPLVRFSSAQVKLKGEDCVFLEPRNALPGTEDVASQWELPFNMDTSEEEDGHVWGDVQSDRCDFGVYAVFDGHGGSAASKHCKEVFLQLLVDTMPLGAPPPESNEAKYTRWREDLQRALAVAFTQMQHTFAAKGIDAGSTATVILQIGWLITCANVGDSLGFIETSSEMLPLTADHRVSENPAEQERIKKAGGTITNVDRSGHGPAADPAKGVGGLRVWPGGMANARAIGHFSAGHLLLSSPFITQILVPPGTGARLFISSDGVWDSLHGNAQQRVSKLIRRSPCRSAPGKVISAIIASDSLRDDTSIVVVELTSPGTDFAGMGSLRGAGGSLSRRFSSTSMSPVMSTINEGSKGGAKGGGCCFSPCAPPHCCVP